MLNRRFMLPAGPVLLSLAMLACSLGGQSTPPTAAPTAAPADTATLPPATTSASTTPAATQPAKPGPLPEGFSPIVTAPAGAEDRTGLYARLVLDGSDNPIIAYEISDLNGDGDYTDSTVLVTVWDAAAGK